MIKVYYRLSNQQAGINKKKIPNANKRIVLIIVLKYLEKKI